MRINVDLRMMVMESMYEWERVCKCVVCECVVECVSLYAIIELSDYEIIKTRY